MSALALDTSVAVPLLVRKHADHAAVRAWWADRPVALSGHALHETYSVLTRLPGELRVSPHDAAAALRERFAEPLLLSPEATRRVPHELGERGIGGGAVYDALVALAAIEHGAELATRDARARSTYEALGARVVIAAGGA